MVTIFSIVTIAILVSVLYISTMKTNKSTDQRQEKSGSVEIEQEPLQGNSLDISRLSCDGTLSSAFPTVYQLSNEEGRIGGYVVSPTIPDDPVMYYDEKGALIATFTFIDTDEEKEKALVIIKQQSSDFPYTKGCTSVTQKTERDTKK
jgi:hypothetical protein